MKVCLIGSTSFLARNIALLLKNHTVVSYNRESQSHNYHYPDASINSISFDKLIDCEAIIFCAGAGIQPDNQQSDELINSLNFQEPINLIKKLNLNYYKGMLITFGSYFEIGVTYKRSTFNETQLIKHSNKQPNAYCQSKHKLTTRIAKQLQKGNTFTHTHLILSNIYGFGENNNRLIPYLIKSLQGGEEISLTSGSQFRQYTHVKDVAGFITNCILNTDIEGIFNFSNPEIIQVQQVVETLLEIYPSEITSVINFGSAEKRDSSMTYLALDYTLTSSTFGYDKFISLKKGLMEYL